MNTCGINQHISLGSRSTTHKIGEQRHEWYRKYETYAATWYTLWAKMWEDQLHLCFTLENKVTWRRKK